MRTAPCSATFLLLVPWLFALTACTASTDGEGGSNNGGSGGSSAAGMGGDATGGEGGVATGGGGQGGSGPCYSCNAWLDPYEYIEVRQVCGFDPETSTGSAALLMDFLNCTCGEDLASGACGAGDCADFCSTGAIEQPCETCFGTHCGTELAACQAGT